MFFNVAWIIICHFEDESDHLLQNWRWQAKSEIAAGSECIACNLSLWSSLFSTQYYIYPITVWKIKLRKFTHITITQIFNMFFVLQWATKWPYFLIHLNFQSFPTALLYLISSPANSKLHLIQQPLILSVSARVCRVMLHVSSAIPWVRWTVAI